MISSTTAIAIFCMFAIVVKGQYDFTEENTTATDELSSVEKYELRTECRDPLNERSYKIGENWTIERKCEAYQCVQFDVSSIKGANRKSKFAIAKSMTCLSQGEIMPLKFHDPDYCEFVPEDEFVLSPFPFCCGMYICIRSNEIKVYRTGMGGYKDKTKRGMRYIPKPKYQ